MVLNVIVSWLAIAATAVCAACAGELGVEDFRLDGPLGSGGTRIEKVGRDHFRATLGHAPKRPSWSNKLQFEIRRNARGKKLRIDVAFAASNAYRFNEYFHSYSYDGRTWHPVQWQKRTTKPKDEGDTLVFPAFTEDRVLVGHQVPMSYEDVVRLVEKYAASKHVKVHVLGKSLGGRNLYRLEITDTAGEVPRPRRWVHYFANQHPGEHNSQWRMVGMIDWLLSDEGADARRRSLCHFVLMMSPDAPSQGWYRVNAQGVDMNRSYKVGGAEKKTQAHEAYLCQKDLEQIMASDAPATTVWSMHTWGGKVDPLITPGPEMAEPLGAWTKLKEIIQRNDAQKLIRALRQSKQRGLTTWSGGPGKQFGITAVLCEGAGGIYTKRQNVLSGAVLMKSIAQYYRRTRPAAGASKGA